MGSDMVQGPLNLPLWQHHRYLYPPWEWTTVRSWRTRKSRDGEGHPKASPPPLSLVKSLGRSWIPRADGVKSWQQHPAPEDAVPSEPGSDGWKGWVLQPHAGDWGVSHGAPLLRGIQPQRSSSKRPSSSRSFALATAWGTLMPSVAPPVRSSLQRGTGSRHHPKAMPSAPGWCRVWPRAAAAFKRKPKPFPGWVGQGGMKVPTRFGAKSGLNTQALLHPGTRPGSTAPRLPLARSWPQKCQFHSNLGFKGVWGSGGKCWRRKIWKQPCIIQVTHLWKCRRTAESKAWNSWGNTQGQTHRQTLAKNAGSVPQPAS